MMEFGQGAYRASSSNAGCMASVTHGDRSGGGRGDPCAGTAGIQAHGGEQREFG